MQRAARTASMVCVLQLAIAMAGCAVVAIAIRVVRGTRRRWLVVTVDGARMAPALRDRQWVLARRIAPMTARALRPGAIVVVALPEHERTDPRRHGIAHRVQRIAAVAGEPVPAWAHRELRATDRTRVPRGHVVVAYDAGARETAYADVRAIVAVVR